MELTIQFSYVEAVIPPRCRKPWDMTFEGETVVNIPEVTFSDAPIALRWHDRYPHGDRPKTSTYRWYGGKLWTRYARGRTSGAKVAPMGRFNPDGTSNDYDLNFHSYDYAKWHPFAEREKRVHDFYAKFLLIGGKVYRKVSEPMWVICTFGLGHNHGIGGGTALMVDEWYNSNRPWNSYFNLKDREAAIAAAEKVALNRGDTKALPISPSERFEILIPEALTADPQRDYGGAGDPFINQIEGIIQATPDATSAGLLSLGALASSL